MIDVEQLLNLAKKVGFSNVASLDVKTIKLRPEVRQMCASNTCGQYGKRWSCPPGCGELETLQETVDKYRSGILVQTVGNLEDDFDVDAMMETERIHKVHMVALQDFLKEKYPHALTIGSGCCTHCKICSYPHLPCRFPEKQMASMEAFGMVVMDVCRANNMKYYYGSHTLSHTGCFLIE